MTSKDCINFNVSGEIIANVQDCFNFQEDLNMNIQNYINENIRIINSELIEPLTICCGCGVNAKLSQI